MGDHVPAETPRLTASLSEGAGEPVAAPAVGLDRAYRLELAMAASGLGDWSWDGPSGRVTLSPRAARIFGFAPDAALNWEALRRRFHPEDLARARVEAVSAAGGETFEFECRLVRDDGAEAWAQVRGEARYENGTPASMVGGVSDISRAKAAEARLRESEARFRAMADSAPAPVWVTSPAGPVEFVNQAFAEFAGRDGHELVGDYWMTFIHPEDLPGVGRKREEARRGPDPYVFEARFLRADGEWRLMQASSKPRFDETGVFCGYTGLAVDITETREAGVRQKLLINELNHRVKNTLATVQSVVNQTLRQDIPATEAREVLTSRLMALAAAHDVLTRENWESAGVQEIVDQAVGHLDGAGARRFDARGPAVRLPPKSALAMSMALHELGTNAVKYGALSNETGRVRIDWALDHAAEAPTLALTWREAGGPPVAVPAASGFGSRLLRQGLATDLGSPAELTYAADGLSAVIRARLLG
jgi:PAS domain S-box-containing protein